MVEPPPPPPPDQPTAAAQADPAGRGPEGDGWGIGREGRWPTASPVLLRRLSVASMAMVALIVLTGAAVRLTDSGLGCSDWPDCSSGHLTPPLQFHSLIEFSNRCVTVVLVVVVGATLLAALRRRPFRRDLSWLAGGLVAGVLAQAVLGGIVVYTKLNPYLVALHFLATIALLADAVVLVHRSERDYTSGSGRLLVPRALLRLGRFVLVLLGLVIVAGTATTGTGPHAGDTVGQLAAKRIPVPLRDMAELHSSLALLLVGTALGLSVGLHVCAVPERLRHSGRMLLVVLVAQAAVGYTQYFTHLPPLLVELHMLGVTVLVIGTLQCYLSLTHHGPELAPGATRPEQAVGACGAVCAADGASCGSTCTAARPPGTGTPVPAGAESAPTGP